jgi:outer membrane lipoprotein SlyB
MKGYILAAAGGAVAGGIIVERATKAIPKMMEMMEAH